MGELSLSSHQQSHVAVLSGESLVFVVVSENLQHLALSRGAVVHSQSVAAS